MPRQRKLTASVVADEPPQSSTVSGSEHASQPAWPRHPPSSQSSPLFPQAPPAIPDHQLLRRIGRGSYGEVWLARSVLGALRAIKVVYRSSFDSERPYEREFAGIQRVEPISRAHDAHVDILQVGRNDAAGYFYYVMELADDAAAANLSGKDATFDTPADRAEYYRPHTLKEDLQRHVHLDYETCLRLALALASGLDYLHQHGLVHRDIKPSNIIFVKGNPKLADIGLVTVADATCSFVGTEGYLPPEGPGSQQADLFSLGKLIYEAATGKDRRDYPELPDNWPPVGGEERFLELNAIVLKACKRDPRERYQSAAQLQADLLLLQSGKSVRRTHLLEERLATFSRVAAVLFAISVLATGAYFWAALQTKRAEENLNRAEASELALRDQLRESLLHQARALSLSRQPGQRLHATEALARAASLGVGPDLRTEAARCLGLVDLASVRKFNSPQNETHIYGLDLLRNRKVISDPEGNLTLSSLNDDLPWQHLPGPGVPSWNNYFSPQGRFLASKYHHANSYQVNQLILWDLARSNQVLQLPEGIGPMALDFSPDDSLMVSANDRNEIVIHETATGTERLRFPSGFRPYAIAFDPQGHRIAISSTEGDVQIRDVTNGRLIKTFEHPGATRCLDWHPDGNRLAVPCDDWLVYMWNVEEEHRVGLFVGHKAQTVRVKFSHDGKFLASIGWDRALYLWDVGQIKPLVRAPVGPGTRFVEFSPDNSWVAVSGDALEAEIFQIHPSVETYVVTASAAIAVSQADVNQDGSLLALATHFGLAMQSTVESKTLQNWNVGGMRDVRFLPDNRIVAGGQSGLFLTRHHPDSQSDGPGSFEPLTALLTNRFLGGPNDFDISADRTRLIARSGLNQATLFDLDRQTPLRNFEPHPRLDSVTISSDNRLAATASYVDPSVKIWDVDKGTLLRNLANFGPAQVQFVPHHNLLAVIQPSQCALLDTTTWQPVRIFHRPPAPAENRYPRIVLSDPGHLVAISWPSDDLQLIEFPSQRELLSLNALTQQALCFSKDSKRLYVLGQYGRIYYWDLANIRIHLAGMGLDW